MGNVIDFKSRKDERIMERIEGLKAECKLLEILTGVIQRQDGMKFILQGAQPTFEVHRDDQTTDLNGFCYFVDNDLIIDGWNPCGSIPFNENYFAKRKDTLSHIGFPEIREEKSEYRSTGEPCIVIYGKHK